MKVLIAHNLYRSTTPSGENAVRDAEQRLLSARGHDVGTFFRGSDEITRKGRLGTFQAALATPWNPYSTRAIRQRISEERPDIVHVHNTFPLISPSIFSAIGRRAARVLTLHNYRLFCPAAIPMREGRVCTECLDKRSSIPAVIHGCYRNSHAATLPLAFSVSLHRLLGTWINQVEAFICLSSFQKEIMVKAGLPRERVHVKANFYPGSPDVIDWSERKPYAVFAGRLTAEKGVVNLLRAWQSWGAGAPELRLVGDGELRSELERMAVGLPVVFLGQLPSDLARVEIANARLQVLPSECFEGFPMVVCEAFAFGTPSAVSNLGPLPLIVEHRKSGIVFQPANPQSLLHEVRAAWESPGLLERLGQGARAEFESKYTEDASYDALMKIYQRAIEVSRNG